MSAPALNAATAPLYARDPFNFYLDPAYCSELLFAAEPFVGEIHDPACGIGTIVDAAMRRGLQASGADIVDRAQGRFPVRDFMLALPMKQVDNVVSNPPYSKRLLVPFIRRALEIARFKVAMLVQQKFLWSQERVLLLTGAPVVRIYILVDRPSMPPGDALLAGEVEAEGGFVDYAWVVWSHDHRGPPTTHWLELSADARAARRAARRAKRKGEP